MPTLRRARRSIHGFQNLKYWILVVLWFYGLLTAFTASDQHSQRRRLVVDLRGGLTNQQIMIQEGIILASESKRDLVMPRVRAHVPSTERYAGATVNSQPLRHLVDTVHFVRCVREKFGVRAISDDENVEMSLASDASYYFGQPWGGAIPARARALVPQKNDPPHLPLLRDPNPLAIVIAPFYVLSNRASSVVQDQLAAAQSCLVPAAHVEKRVEALQPLTDYICLHARVEPDWLGHCCKFTNVDFAKLRVNSTCLDDWTCDETGRRPHRRCFSTPRQIADVLQEQYKGNNVAVWLATGLTSRASLEPLYSSFDVHRMPSSTSGNFMDYDRALVDREVCGRARHVWTHRQSTFTWGMTNRSKVRFYNVLVK